ncbi:MAG: Hpt domain-containing protein, partial [Gammaproteobacteria bacterium]
PADAARVAHSLKGAAGNIAALRLAALTKDLEWAVRRQEGSVEEALQAVEQELKRLLESLSKLKLS